MGDWQLPQAGGDFNHSIVVTGIDGSSVFYIDPWDGGSHSLPVGDFGDAWQHKWKDGADAPWYAVLFTSKTALAGAPSAPTPQPQPQATTATAGWQGDGTAYQAEIWTNRGAWRSTGWMNGTIWNSQFAPDPEFLWRVRGVSQSGVVGPWTMPRPVDVGTAVEPTPKVQTPTSKLPPTPTPTPTPTLPPAPAKLQPPPAPTSVTFVDLAATDSRFVECTAPVADQGYCGKVRVAWHWSASAAGTQLLIYSVDGGSWDCFDPNGCGTPPTAQQLCMGNLDYAVLVGSVDPGLGTVDVLAPPPSGAQCVYVVATNKAGSSGKAWAEDVTPQ
jgi:hypothetical protein